MPECRSCGAWITWVVMPSGKAMPVNSEEIPFLIDESSDHLAITPDGEVVRGRTCSESYEPEEGQRWVYARLSHFATCPEADKHRKERSKQ